MKKQHQISRDKLQSIYVVLLKRISSGYSAQELSFLMGKQANYISSIEMLDHPPYTDDDLLFISIALKESELRNYYSRVHEPEMVTVQMERIDSEKKRIYSCDIITDEGYRQPFFYLEEDLPDSQTNKAHAVIAREAVALMIRTGYFFEARFPTDVFRSINKFIEEIAISPSSIQQALDTFCEAETAPIRKYEHEKEVFLYVET
jgi:hypothetical protein